MLINGNNTQIEQFEIPFVEGEGIVGLQLDRLPMSRGLYLFSFSIHSADHKLNYHRLDNVFPISVKADRNFKGATYIPCRWSRE